MRDLFEAVEPYDEDPYVDVRSILYIYIYVCVDSEYVRVYVRM
jgi:hypothetical protein